MYMFSNKIAYALYSSTSVVQTFIICLVLRHFLLYFYWIYNVWWGIHRFVNHTEKLIKKLAINKWLVMDEMFIEIHVLLTTFVAPLVIIAMEPEVWHVSCWHLIGVMGCLIWWNRLFNKYLFYWENISLKQLNFLKNYKFYFLSCFDLLWSIPWSLIFFFSVYWITLLN